MAKKNFRQRSYKWIFYAILAIVALTIGWYAHGVVERIGPAIDKWVNQVAVSWPPIYMTIAIALVPFVLLPFTPLSIMAGAIYGREVGVIVCIAGVALNLLICYFLATHLLSKPLKRLLERKKYQLPKVPKAEHIKLTLLAHLLPIPVVAINALLVLGQVPFRVYFWVSWLMESIYVAAFAVAGEALLQGHWSIAIAIFSLIFVCVWVSKKLASIYQNRHATAKSE